MPIAPGTKIGTYEIQAPLGEGGMGAVYQAHDPTLQRTVAIKVLAKQDADASARLLQEARAASALNHPHICTVYEVGEHEGQAFIVMEHVEGKPLSALIPADGLPPESVIRYGTQIADALAHAHERRIVHRDLKSANVVITPEGRAKVLDFGLAARMPQRDVDGLTKTHEGLPHPGMLVGTLAYMAPEILQGEAATARSDIWALGVLLYEMASGRLPFEGTTAAEIASATLRDSPAALPSRISAGVRSIVQRCLVKEPGQRYRHASAVQAALETISSSTSGAPEVASDRQTPTVPSIAVLPFTDMSPQRDQEYFSDGLTEEVISDLSKIGSLRVISRTSIMSLKGTAKSVKELGRDLQVRYVLEGSVRKAGNNLRVSVQLLNATSDTHLWTDKYTGTLDDIFDIQERLSRNIVEALKLKLSPEEDQRIAERPIENAKAYECYLRATHEIYKMSDAALDRAVQCTQNGLHIIGENELLYSTLGQAYVVQALFGMELDEQHLHKAEQCVAHVFALNPQSRHGFRLTAMIHFRRGERAEAARLFKRALASDPNDVDALVWLCAVYNRAGKGSAAEPFVKTLLDIDPLNPINQHWSSWFEFWDGKEAAVLLPPFRRGYEMDPENAYSQYFYGWALACNHQTAEACAILDKLGRTASESGLGRMARFLGAALKQRDSSALDSVGEELVQWAGSDDAASWGLAECYALIGRTDDAVKWAENAVRLGFINYPCWKQRDPLLDGVRAEPRFEQLVERVKSEWEAFNA